MAACTQGLLLLAGPVFGVLAIALNRGRYGVSVVLPAVLGIIVATGTMALIAFLMARDILK